MSGECPGKASRDIVIQRGLAQKDRHLSGANCIQASSGKVDHGFHLFPSHVILLDDFVDGHAVFQIFENEFDGHAAVPENPRAADFAGNAFDAGALRPIESWHGVTLLLSGYYSSRIGARW